MKRLIPLLLFACFVSQLAAQSRLRLGAEYFANFSSTDDWLLEVEPRLSHTAGLHLSYPLGRQLSLSLGLAYANLGDRYVIEDLRWGDQHNGNGGFDPGQEGEFDLVNKTVFHFAETPLRLTYHSHPGRRLRFYGSVGFAPRILLESQSIHIFKYSNGERERTAVEDLNDWDTLQLSGLAAAGIEYGISEKLLLYGGPRFQHHWLRGTSGLTLTPNEIEANYWQLGLEAGVRFR